MIGLSALNVTVLGAGGFIGGALTQALTSQVNSLKAFGRNVSPAHGLNNCHWVRGDFSNETDLYNAVDGADVVYHLVNAGTPASSNLEIYADLQSNVANTVRLLEVCKVTKVKRVIFVSSGGTVYGLPDVVPTPESGNTNPICAYGISKLSIEKYLGLYEYLHNIDFRVLRLSNPYGPRQLAKAGQGVVAAFMSMALRGAPVECWGDGTVVRDYIYISDAVGALIKAAVHQGEDRVFNIGSGTGVTLNDLIRGIEHAAKVRVKINYSPSRLVDVPVSILDITRAKASLDWSPQISLTDGLGLTANWMRSQTQSW